MVSAAARWPDCSRGRLFEAARQARQKLRHGRVDQQLLAQLYHEYNPVPEVGAFVQQAIGMFPRLCCGLASVYLRHRLGQGVVHGGSYGGQPHTVLVVRDWVLDVTADQFGGAPVYVGPLVAPWCQVSEAAEQADEADEARGVVGRTMVLGAFRGWVRIVWGGTGARASQLIASVGRTKSVTAERGTR